MDERIKKLRELLDALIENCYYTSEHQANGCHDDKCCDSREEDYVNKIVKLFEESLQEAKANKIRKKIDEIKGTPKRIGPNIVNPTLGPKPSTGSSITYFEQAKERSLDRQGDTLLNLGVPNKDAVTEFHWTAGEGIFLTDEQKSRAAKRFGGAISHQGTHFETGCPGCEAMEDD